MRYSTAIVSALFVACAYAAPVQEKRDGAVVTVVTTDVVVDYAATTQIVTQGAPATTPAAAVVTSAPIQVQEAAPTPEAVETVYKSAWTKSWSWSEESAPAPSVAVSTVAAAPTTTQAPASTSAAAPAATSSASYASGSFEDSCVSTHNKYRSVHQAGDLTWNQTMADFAKTVSQTCVFKHSGGPYGENLAAGYSDPSAAITAWYNENSQYNYAAGQFSEATGHFTQLVWKDAKQVGCATVTCNGENNTPGDFLTCEYDTGNVIGYFVQNVLPAAS